MSVLDDVKETLISTGKDVSQKAKDISEVAKLKLDIRAKEDFVEKQYVMLGTDYYMKHKDEEESEAAEQFKVIGEALDEIERMRAEILRIQGALACPKCGSRMPVGAVFCSSCGGRMDDMFEE